MTGIYDPKTRSLHMSRIKAKDTRPEMMVRRFLHAKGYRYRLHDKKLPGKPDIVFPKLKTIIFIHGCFWHGHKNCKYHIIPKTRTEWWIDKINANSANDMKVVALLKNLGWAVIEVWECELRGQRFTETLRGVEELLINKNKVSG